MEGSLNEPDLPTAGPLAPLTSLSDLQVKLGCTTEDLGALVWSDLVAMVQIMKDPPARIREKASGYPFLYARCFSCR